MVPQYDRLFLWVWITKCYPKGSIIIKKTKESSYFLKKKFFSFKLFTVWINTALLAESVLEVGHRKRRYGSRLLSKQRPFSLIFIFGNIKNGDTEVTPGFLHESVGHVAAWIRIWHLVCTFQLGGQLATFIDCVDLQTWWLTPLCDPTITSSFRRSGLRLVRLLSVYSIISSPARFFWRMLFL